MKSTLPRLKKTPQNTRGVFSLTLAQMAISQLLASLTESRPEVFETRTGLLNVRAELKDLETLERWAGRTASWRKNSLGVLNRGTLWLRAKASELEAADATLAWQLRLLAEEFDSWSFTLLSRRTA